MILPDVLVEKHFSEMFPDQGGTSANSVHSTNEFRVFRNTGGAEVALPWTHGEGRLRGDDLGSVWKRSTGTRGHAESAFVETHKSGC
jgi:hypothetical protein